MVTKKTYNKNVRKYAKGYASAFDDLTKFVNDHCKGGAKKRDEALDIVCSVVDRYINLNIGMREWCEKNGVGIADFACDVMNRS